MNKQNFVIAAGLALFTFTTRSEANLFSNYTARSQIELTNRVGSGRAHQCQQQGYRVPNEKSTDDSSDGGALGKGEVSATDDAQGGSDPATEQQNTEADSGQEAASDDSAVAAESDADSQETTEEEEAEDPDSAGDDTEDAADEETADEDEEG
jgi:hypothetical protein